MAKPEAHAAMDLEVQVREGGNRPALCSGVLDAAGLSHSLRDTASFPAEFSSPRLPAHSSLARPRLSEAALSLAGVPRAAWVSGGGAMCVHLCIVRILLAGDHEISAILGGPLTCHFGRFDTEMTIGQPGHPLLSG